MSPRNVAPAPLDDHRMWRRVLARLHDDGGGSHEMFLFGQALREAVAEFAPQASPCSRCPREGREGRGGPPRSRGARADDIIREEGRVPFPAFADFEGLTRKARRTADEVEDIFAKPLRLLYDCRHAEGLAREQERGATFKQLAAIGHAVGMGGAQRSRWYEIAKSVPLAQRHASHVLGKLKGRRSG